MAPGMKLFKRQANEPDEADEVEETTTIHTNIFGKHLHKVKLTTPTTTMETEGESRKVSEKIPPSLLVSSYAEDESTPEPTESTGKKIQEKAFEVAGAIGEKTGIPAWGVVAIFVLIALIILGICGFCIRRCFRKRRSKDGKKGMKGVDLKSVQLLGSAYKEKVNIIMSMSVWLLSKKKIPKK